MPQWGRNVPLRSLLAGYFPAETAILVENAGKLTARPVSKEPALEDKRVATLFTTWGISSCLIDRGEIETGHSALIGEIGHMVIRPEDPERCGCGSRGCLERLISHRRLRDSASRLHEAGVPTRMNLAELRPLQLFRASASGDELARHVVSVMADVMATGLRNLSLVFDPDVVVFQGDYAHADSYFDRCLRDALADFRYYPERAPFEIRYDRRPLTELDAEGGYLALAEVCFSKSELIDGE